MEGLLTYKDYAVMRQNSIIYYGNMNDSHIVMMQILSFDTVADQKIAKKISIQLLLTDETLQAKERIIKRAEKEGMFAALDVASVWLDRVLKKS